MEAKSTIEQKKGEANAIGNNHALKMKNQMLQKIDIN